MVFKVGNSKAIKVILILVLFFGMFGAKPIQPVHAATLVVTNTNSSGAGSLSQTINDASSGDVITFDFALSGTTISFGGKFLSKNLTIDATNLDIPITLQGNNSSRLFQIAVGITVELKNIVLTNSTGYNLGGAVYNEGTLKLTRSMLSNNTASGFGGGIYNKGELIVIESTFSNNRAIEGDGGAIWNQGMLTIANSTIMNNSASASCIQNCSGAIYNLGEMTVTNSTFYGNYPSAIHSYGKLTIKNSTLAYNQGFGVVAGGNYNTGSNTSELHFINTILAQNQSSWNSASQDCYNNGAMLLSNISNLIESGNCGVAALSSDPRLDALTNNGGSTQTMALLPDSPAIDAGDDESCLSADQRGVARPQRSHCDIGAYEYKSSPVVYYVKQNATGANNGTSWTNAYIDLQSALATASSSDEIWVAAGTYKPTIGTDRTISFTLKDGVAVYGGFVGTESLLSERDYAKNLTILSGDIGVIGDKSDNSYHVAVANSVDNGTLLDGFTITGGNANGTSPYNGGGGMYSDIGSPKLNNIIFTDNYAALLGGGLYAFSTAFYTDQGQAFNLDLTGVVFSNNATGGNGGGMATSFYLFPSASFNVNLTDVSFTNNVAERVGGGMDNTGGHLTLLDVTFSGNAVVGGGGGLSSAPYPSSTLTNVTFSNNSADEGGGGMLVGSDGPTPTTLTNVTFDHNSTAINGGGIVNAGSHLILTNVTFSDNTADANGGGIFNGEFAYVKGEGTIDLINATFSNNVSNSNGGAIYNEGGNVNVHNSILYGDSGGEIYGTAGVTYSIVQGGYTGSGNLDADPKLDSLKDNGGFTQTMALLPGSPAINTGDDTNCPGTDQRGATRPRGSHCDIGAYEYQSDLTVHYVKQDATGENNGTSWTNAYTDLQSALAAASSGDEIWVAGGTYKPTTGTDRSISFVLKNGLAIYGGFYGVETLRSQRDPRRNLTVLSGDTGIQGDNRDNSYHVVMDSKADNSAVLDGFTIVAGNANADDYLNQTDKGGGFYNDRGSPTISNIIFSNNYAMFGGGMYSGDTNFDNVNESSSPILTNVKFIGNSAIEGGGMGNQFYSSPTLTKVVFITNTATRAGGGLLNDDHSSPALLDVIFSANTAAAGGGIYDSGQSNANLTNVTFYGNFASDRGGGMANISSDTTVTNATFYENDAAKYGGAVSNESSSNLSLTNVTLSKNSAVTYGGGIYNDAYGSATTIQNSILYGDTGGEIYNEKNTSVVNQSIVQGGYAGTGNLNVDPQLGPLQNNGGFTLTMALSSGSPAINAGDDETCPAADQRGVSRSQGSHCDIGAYEFVQNLPTFTWNTFQGGQDHDLVTDMTTDSFGNLYVTGSSGSPVWEKSPLHPLTGNTDAYVAKFNSKGTLLWYTFLGANTTDHGDWDTGTAISLDADGNIYVTGSSLASWGNDPIRSFSGNEADDVFIAKLNPSGELQWNTFLGGDESDYPFGMAIDKDGNIFVTGRSAASWGAGTPAPLNPFVGVPHNNNNAFIAKLSSNGTLQWHTFIGNGSESGMDITVDKQGALYTIGYGLSWGNPIRPYTNDDTYVAKFNADGALQWNTFLGGEGVDTAFGIVLSDTNDIFVYGESSTSWGDAPVEVGEGGYSDGFIAKLTSDGNLLWNTFIGGDEFDRVSGLAIDPSDNSILISGESQSVWGSSVMTPYNADGNIYLAKMNPSGSTQWNAFFGHVPYYNIGSTHLVAIWNHAAYVVGSALNSWGEPLHPFSSQPNSGYADLYLLKAELSADPIVSSITRADINPTNSANVQFNVAFSEQVTGVEASDFRVTASGVTNPKIVNVARSGDTYTVTVNTGSGNGTIRLDVVDDDSIQDAAKNPLGGAGFGNGNFSGGEVYTIDKSTPFADVHVLIGGVEQGNYTVFKNSSTRPSYVGVDTGPVRVMSVNGMPIVASLRDLWSDGTNPSSSVQLMGLPAGQLSSTYVFPAYNNVSLDDQLRFGNVGSTSTTVTVTIGGVLRGSYNLAPSQSMRVNYAGVDSGPVVVQSSSNVPIIASIRDSWWDGTAWSSYSQLMGLPGKLLSSTYVFPAYNNVSLDDQLRFGNVGTATTTVTVTIGGVVRGSYLLAPNESRRVYYPGVDGGPVVVQSSGNVPIIASIRDSWKDGNDKWSSYFQLMGLPGSQLSSTYIFPVYDNVNVDAQLRVGNVGIAPTNVTVTIGGVYKGTYSLNPGQSIRVSYPDVNAGPLIVQSSGNVPIIASIRDSLWDGSTWSSYSQLMGLPASQLSTTYVFPAYNNVSYDNELRIAVP